MLIRSFLSILSLFLVVSTANAQSISTSFDNATFATGSTAPTTLTNGSLSAIFGGGFQEQQFHGPAYNAGPDAYFFVNGGPGGFTGSFGRTAFGSTDVGSIDFNTGVDSLSFFASRFGNGTPSFRVLGVDDTTVLASSSITAGSNQNGAGATPFTFDSLSLGGQIGSIEFDNAGPAGNPPYLIAIDSFSASINAVPEPSSAMSIVLAVGGLVLRRRRS